MDFKPSNKVSELCHKLQSFMKARILPVEDEFRNYMVTTSNKWETPPLFEKLKEYAKVTEVAIATSDLRKQRELATEGA